jgi:SNF2 family DNA or RNA helicase
MFDFTHGRGNHASTVRAPRTASDSILQRRRQQEADSLERRRLQLLRDTEAINSLNYGLPVQRLAAGQPSTQSVLNRDGTIRRVSSQSADMSFKAEPSGSAFGAGPSHASPQTPFMPKDNKPQPQIQIGSDSELEEIDVEQFITASRRRAPNRPAMQQQAVQPPVYAMPGQYPVNGYGQTALQQMPHPFMTSNGVHGTSQYYGLQPQHAFGFMPNDPTSVGVRRAMMNNMTMPGTFPGGATLPGQSSYAVNVPGRPSISRPFQPSPSPYNPNMSQSRVPSNVVDLSADSDDDGLGEYGFLRNDPSRSAEEIKELIEHIATGADLSPEVREGTPDSMKFPLMEHQKIGLTWMKEKENAAAKGGILADDMGLGKTIQAIALMVSHPSEDRARKTTLVVAPVALLRQWSLEIKDKIKPGRALSVYIHHSQKKKSFSQLRQFDVVLTTYGSLTSELKKKQHWDQVVANEPNAAPTKKERLSLLGHDCLWYRVILDEAQNIKNKNAGAARAAFQLNSIYRWCMTGTPMMNNVGELWPLIAFCRLRPYNDINRFRSEIKNPLGNRYEDDRKDAMRKLQALIRGIMLRRTKSSKIDGKPIITLQPRTTDVVTRDFDKDQEDFYRAIETKSANIFNKYLKQGSVMRNYSHILTMLLRLRQICDHPVLATEVISDSGTDTPAEVMLALAKKLSPDTVRRLMEQKEDFICPICIDAIPPPGPVIFFPCGHYLDNDCLSSLAMSATSNMEPDLKCPECREKFDQNKVIDYPTFKRVYLPEDCKEEGTKDEDGTEDGSCSDTDSDTDSDSDDDLDGFIVPDGVEDDEDEEYAAVKKQEGNEDEGDEAGVERKPAVRASKKGRKKKGKGKGKGKQKSEKKSLAQLRTEGRRNKKTWAKYLRRLKKTWESSAKIDKTLELIEQLDTTKPREQILIFSQFTSFLDFLEVPLNDRNISYRRYDGSMSTKDREDAVMDFRTQPGIRLMLISLKAGNAGLNLSCASQVIILDPFWNPFIEEQAIDRAHRIGQQHEVNVHRIVIPNTVEDRIVQLQDKKRELITTALDENAGKSLARLGVRELGFLFGIHRNAGPD